jgi:hypothetical protein
LSSNISDGIDISEEAYGSKDNAKKLPIVILM